jgi:hypothetical protein
MTATATYLYAITRPVAAEAVADLRGIDGTPVRVIEHGELAALVGTVDLADFGERALAEHLADLQWLARAAREHDEVVRAASRVTTTMPLRMATVCQDDDAVHARLESVRGAVLAVLPDLDDRDEWGVKMFAIAGTADPAVAEAAAAEPAAGGAAYLLQRRRQLTSRDEWLETASRAAFRAFGRLAEVAAASRQQAPQDRRLTGAAHPMVLNAAFLVSRRDEDAFRAAVADVAAEWPPGSVELTGPWPPYSFVPTDDR